MVEALVSYLPWLGYETCAPLALFCVFFYFPFMRCSYLCIYPRHCLIYENHGWVGWGISLITLVTWVQPLLATHSYFICFYTLLLLFFGISFNQISCRFCIGLQHLSFAIYTLFVISFYVYFSIFYFDYDHCNFAILKINKVWYVWGFVLFFWVISLC